MQAIYICVSRRERRYIKTDSLLFVALRTIRAQFDIARFLSSLTMNKRYEARTTSVCDHYLRRAHIIEHQRCILRCSQLLQPLAAHCSPLYSLINMQHRMRQVAECQATIFLRFSNYVSSLLFSAAHGSTLQIVFTLSKLIQGKNIAHKDALCSYSSSSSW